MWIVDSARQVSCQNPVSEKSAKMGEDWEKARDWLNQKSVTRMSAKVPILYIHTMDLYDNMSLLEP